MATVQQPVREPRQLADYRPVERISEPASVTTGARNRPPVLACAFEPGPAINAIGGRVEYTFYGRAAESTNPLPRSTTPRPVLSPACNRARRTELSVRATLSLPGISAQRWCRHSLQVEAR